MLSVTTTGEYGAVDAYVKAQHPFVRESLIFQDKHSTADAISKAKRGAPYH
jgi:hypothetical protein